MHAKLLQIYKEKEEQTYKREPNNKLKAKSKNIFEF